MPSDNLVSLVEWANKNGHTDAAARKLIKRGKLPEARKIGKYAWTIQLDIEWPSDRKLKEEKK